VSVTRVAVAADLRVADVYLSIFGNDEASQKKTFEAITHARSRIQSLLAEEMQSKFCPVLRFQMDEQFKKTLETIRLIEQTTSEREKRGSADENQEQK
jgi:ribosome-binding factor A